MGSAVVLGIESSCDETGVRAGARPADRVVVRRDRVRGGARPAPLEVSTDPSAPLEYAALHPVARAGAGVA
ncbi:hypothetical protein GCM10015535_04330 [Streptomyces gelaticus]|uniref:tRNA (Adenosine(37)-N6)-threonylcarbamoyltransferase complex transferase subunit TsaD n=1 Tax=Streptomyces gelaticus TaxID=285446 RepID=A0ABQ2VT95_9ACTN|nr:hypothetical protein GCM10015535_04330 [Streptomyces gelaticus]